MPDSAVPSSDLPDEPTSEKPARKKPKPVLSTKSKQLTVGRLPEDLVVHLNRSIFDMYGNQRKNTAVVDFPLRLSIVNRWCAPLDDASGHTVQAAYALQCVVTHAGRHDDGHYIAYAKRGKGWYCFNDEVVTQVSEEFVASRGNAFMLFYEVDTSPVLPEKAAEPADNHEGVVQSTSIAALIEKERTENIDAQSQVKNADIRALDATTEVQTSAHASRLPLPSPQDTSGITTTDEPDEDTMPSSTATSDAEIEVRSHSEIRLETSLPPMRTAGDSSSMHQRMESSHAAPVF